MCNVNCLLMFNVRCMCGCIIYSVYLYNIKNDHLQSCFYAFQDPT